MKSKLKEESENDGILTPVYQLLSTLTVVNYQ